VHEELGAHRYPHPANSTSEAFLTSPTRRVRELSAPGYPAYAAGAQLVA